MRAINPTISSTLHCTMRIKLAQALRDAILNRSYLPGQKLTEGEFCTRYRISHTPLREAFVVLEQEGLVEIRSHLGVYVATLSNQEIIDLLRVEIALEGLAAAQAAVRITDSQLAELQTIHQKIREVAREQDLDTFYRYDRRFHSLLIAFSASATLIKIMEKQLSRIYLSRFYTMLAPNRLQHSINEHQEIIQMLQRHDPQKAKEALVHHLESVIRDFVDMSSQSQPIDNQYAPVRLFQRSAKRFSKRREAFFCANPQQ